MNLSILSHDSPTLYAGHNPLYDDSLVEVVWLPWFEA